MLAISDIQLIQEHGPRTSCKSGGEASDPYQPAVEGRLYLRLHQRGTYFPYSGKAKR